MIAAPMLVQDAKNNTLPTPITRSYSEGLDFGDYWLAQHGARKGTLQRVLGTEAPGTLSKDISNTTISTLIVSPDCKTSQGILMDPGHKDIHDRFISRPIPEGWNNLKEGTLLTPEVTAKLKNSKIDKVLVRSPLKCQHGNGLCAKCFGLNGSGTLHDVGTNIGILAGAGSLNLLCRWPWTHSIQEVLLPDVVRSLSTVSRLRQLLLMTNKLKNSATLARVTGKVTDIKKDAVGGVDVFVGNEHHYVPKHLVSEKIKPGRSRGEPVSEVH